MLRIRTKTHVFIGVALAACVAVALVQIHVSINYPPELQALVRFKATLATVVVTMIISSVILTQYRQTSLLTERLQELVNRDRLTNVATRDFFFESMRENPSAFGTYLMIDIDKFKSVNDTYGHFAGDAVIARVASILTKNVRDGDLVCRFGGEEFIVFLDKQPREAGFAIAERMRKAIEEDVLDHEGARLNVTVSIGGSLKDRIKDIEMAIQEADEALYRAKNSGRNQTIFADPKEGATLIDLWEGSD